MPNYLLVQKAYGTEIKDAVNVGHMSEAKELDMGHSRVFTGTTFTAFDQQGNDVTASKIKASDDFAIVGYSAQGLPFTILMDGSPWMSERRQDLINFSDQVLQQVSVYAERLASCTAPQDTIKALILELYQQLMQNGEDEALDFTLSLAITYEKNSNLYCAGFGIGDIGLVLKRTSGEIETLASNTIIYDESSEGQYDRRDKDGFTAACGNSVERQQRIIERNSVFNIAIDAGDEIFGYTSLPNSMCSPQSEAQFTAHFRKDLPAFSDAQQKVVKSTLDIPIIWQRLSANNVPAQSHPSFIGTDLLTIILNGIDQFGQKDIIETAKAAAKKDNYQGWDGDDCALTSMTVPGPLLQLQLKTLVALQTVTEAYLHVHNGSHQLWQHKKGKERAIDLLTMIRDNNSYDSCIRQAAINASQSGISLYSYARYIQNHQLCQDAIAAVQVPNKRATSAIAATAPSSQRNTHLTGLPEKKTPLNNL